MPTLPTSSKRQYALFFAKGGTGTGLEDTKGRIEHRRGKAKKNQSIMIMGWTIPQPSLRQVARRERDCALHRIASAFASASHHIQSISKLIM